MVEYYTGAARPSRKKGRWPSNPEHPGCRHSSCRPGIGVDGGYLDNESIHRKIARMIERFAHSIGAELNEYSGICLKKQP